MRNITCVNKKQALAHCPRTQSAHLKLITKFSHKHPAQPVSMTQQAGLQCVFVCGGAVGECWGWGGGGGGGYVYRKNAIVSSTMMLSWRHYVSALPSVVMLKRLAHTGWSCEV